MIARHPLLSAVHYPGLASHPGHLLALKQQQGFGAMLSLELQSRPGEVADFLGRLRRFILAESLGGFESLIAHPATLTHAAMEPDARATAGINDGLFRLSIGLEAFDDLWFDLRAALDAIRIAR